MAESVNATQHIYDNLWSEGVQALENGKPDIDPYLADRKNDPRRCVTLALRLPLDVRLKVKHFLHLAAKAIQGQHLYREDELHLTVLAIIPSSASWQEHMHELPVIQNVLTGLLQNRSSFSIKFRGVTVSRNAVMIQGFPADDSLTRLRDELRAALKHNNVGANIDRRYRITGAHITTMRFIKPNADWERLLELLKNNRATDFGETRVQTLELLFSDFYASADVVRTLETYQLA